MKTKKNNKRDNQKDENRCEYATPDARQCTELRAKSHPSLCVHHWRREQKLDPSKTPEAAAHVAEVLGSISQLNTTTAVNDALAKLFTLRSRKLISSRDTVVLSYVIQLLLQTLHETKDEFTRLYKWSDWDDIIERAIQKAIGPDGSLQTGIPESTSSVSESLHRRKRSKKLPATRQEFGRELLTEYLLSKGMIEDPPDEEEQLEEEVEQEEAEEHEEAGELVNNTGFVVHTETGRVTRH